MTEPITVWMRYLPGREMSWPPITLVTSRPADCGVEVMPEAVAEAFRAVCTNRPRYWIAPNMPMPKTNTARFETTNVRFLKRWSGMIASGWRASWATNNSVSTMAAVSRPMIWGELHGYFVPA